jgi:hypothetical protein
LVSDLLAEDQPVRRFLIQGVLPLLFCAMPLLAAGLVAMATPEKAWTFYLQHLSPIDRLILGLGGAIFAVQLILCWRSLQWRGTSFDVRPDRWLSNLAQAAEWFPLLGLIGTVAGILVTFGTIGEQAQTAAGRVRASDVVGLYAPAITATGSGLFMALINILPTWVVLLGRDLILTLGGGGPSTSGEIRP